MLYWLGILIANADRRPDKAFTLIRLQGAPKSKTPAYAGVQEHVVEG